METITLSAKGDREAWAALLAQQAFFAFRKAQETAAGLGLRIGLFAGPCHLVSLQGVLDYFGITPLLCWRLLREAHAEDIMLPAEPRGEA